MKITFLGLSITSAWGNGHATTYRSLLRALRARGHELTFLECAQDWYLQNQDLAEADYAKIILYESWDELKVLHANLLLDSDAVILGSYVLQGREIGTWLIKNRTDPILFYDIDTPITLRQLQDDSCPYLSAALISKFDLYLSFSGGKALEILRSTYNAQRAEAFYCSVDPEIYYPEDISQIWRLGYLGTYSADRQIPLEEFLLQPARELPHHAFVVAGAQYPAQISWPDNVEHITHVSPNQHRQFYNRQAFTLNLTRADMVRLGHSPSVRLFEAAACGTPLISDSWPGLEEFFNPGQEILIARKKEEVKVYLNDLSSAERTQLANAARKRILQEHTAAHRAALLEDLLFQKQIKPAQERLEPSAV